MISTTVVDDPADRWLRRSCNQNQIQFCIPGHLPCLFRRHNAELFSVCTDHTDFLLPDLLVNRHFRLTLLSSIIVVINGFALLILPESSGADKTKMTVADATVIISHIL